MLFIISYHKVIVNYYLHIMIPLLYEKVKATEVLRLELRREREGSFGGRRRVAFTTLQIAICDFP